MRTREINKLPKARENAGDRVVIGLSFLIDREGGVFWPITGRSKTKTVRFRVTFDTQNFSNCDIALVSPLYLSAHPYRPAVLSGPVL